jgi:hypothetical protein
MYTITTTTEPAKAFRSTSNTVQGWEGDDYAATLDEARKLVEDAYDTVVWESSTVGTACVADSELEYVFIEEV